MSDITITDADREAVQEWWCGPGELTELIEAFARHRLTPGANRWLERSATYPGIAKAMGDQWSEINDLSRLWAA